MGGVEWGKGIGHTNFIPLDLVVQKVDNAIHRINHYPADSVVCCVNTYPLDNPLDYRWDSDLSGG